MGTSNKIVLLLLLPSLLLLIITIADGLLLNRESPTPSFSLFYFGGSFFKLIIGSIFSSIVATEGISCSFRLGIDSSSF